MKLKIFKIRDGKKRQWLDWCKFLIAHETEVQETLREEKVTREINYLFDDYVLYVMEGDCLPSSDREMNRLHKKNKVECLELVEGTTLFDISAS
jgi:hypothetical protein